MELGMAQLCDGIWTKFWGTKHLALLLYQMQHELYTARLFIILFY